VETDLPMAVEELTCPRGAGLVTQGSRIAMADLIAVKCDGSRDIKFRVPKTAQQVVDALERRHGLLGSLVDRDGIDRIGDDDMEAGDYTFEPSEGTVNTELRNHTLGGINMHLSS
jgi:hypothetical protein